jgi:hypothetical protein
MGKKNRRISLPLETRLPVIPFPKGKAAPIADSETCVFIPSRKFVTAMTPRWQSGCQAKSLEEEGGWS